MINADWVLFWNGHVYVYQEKTEIIGQFSMEQPIKPVRLESTVVIGLQNRRLFVLASFTGSNRPDAFALFIWEKSTFSFLLSQI